MRLRHSLEVLRRRKWSTVTCAVVVGIAFAGIAWSRSPEGSATARVELRGASGNGDASGTIDATAPSRTAPLMDAPTKRAVADRAADLASGIRPSEFLGEVTLRRVGTTDMVDVIATSTSAARATRVANGFARAFVEARRAAIVASVQRALADLEAQMTTVQTRIDELDQRIGTRTASTATAAQLSAATTEFQALDHRHQSIQDDRSLGSVTATVVHLASDGGTIANLSLLELGLLGGLAFLMLSAILAAFLEAMDDRVRSSEELARITGLPVLAELPRDPEARKHFDRLAVAASPRSPLSEAARALRSSIELRELHHRRGTLLITSAAAGEGKSLVSANLAAAYAVAGYRTVLIDADLRTPKLTTVLGTYPARLISSHQVVHGLSSLLTELTHNTADRPKLEQAALLRTPVENLLFLPAGPEPDQPSELLDSHAMSTLLADFASIADVVIIDCPPLLPVSDAVGLARLVDSVMLVGAIGESDCRSLRRARQILAAHPRVLGVVANKVAPRSVYSYASHAHRRSLDADAAARLKVVRTLPVPTPTTGRPDANGDVWIDLSDEPDEPLAPTGALQLSAWSR